LFRGFPLYNGIQGFKGSTPPLAGKKVSQIGQKLLQVPKMLKGG
jgi:hypothetical protein